MTAKTYLIGGSVSHKYFEILGSGTQLHWVLIDQRQPAAQRDDACQLSLCAKTIRQSDSTTLTEAADNDAMLRNSIAKLLVDDSIDTLHTAHDAHFVIRCIFIESTNIEPTWHAVTHIHRHGLFIGGGEDSLNMIDTLKRKRGRPTVTRIAEAVKKDHGSGGLHSGGNGNTRSASVHGSESSRRSSWYC